MNAATTLFVLLCVGAALSESVSGRSRYCLSHNDCAPGQCCLLQPGIRYSRPTCQSQPQEGEVCKPDVQTIVNKVFTYPDGDKITVQNAHFTLCPCTTGLSCSRSEGVCRISNNA